MEINYKYQLKQDNFKAYTTNTKMMSTIFNSKDNINILAQRFIKKLDGCIKKNFKRVGMSNNKTRGPYLGRVTFILNLCVLVGLGLGWSWLLFVLVCLG